MVLSTTLNVQPLSLEQFETLTRPFTLEKSKKSYFTRLPKELVQNIEYLASPVQCCVYCPRNSDSPFGFQSVKYVLVFQEHDHYTVKHLKYILAGWRHKAPHKIMIPNVSEDEILDHQTYVYKERSLKHVEEESDLQTSKIIFRSLEKLVDFLKEYHRCSPTQHLSMYFFKHQCRFEPKVVDILGDLYNDLIRCVYAKNALDILKNGQLL
jgi:hypothetical protein